METKRRDYIIKCTKCRDILIEPETDALAFLSNQRCEDCKERKESKNIDKALDQLDRSLRAT